MKTVKEMIAVMQAYLDGRKIEAKPNSEKYWNDVGNPVWDWQTYDYRIAPQEIEVHVYKNTDYGNYTFEKRKLNNDSVNWKYLGKHTIKVSE